MPRVTIIDGRSASGKTTLAERLARETGAELLRLDSLYPGWDGLAAGSAAVPRALAEARYQVYDWSREEFGDVMTLERERPLVIEGCGALTQKNLAAARSYAGPAERVHTVWLECPESLRHRRALTRDGEMFRPHWDRWAKQERDHFALARPVALAAEIVHTARVD